MNYRIKKLEIKKGHYSGVRPGMETTSSTAMYGRDGEQEALVIADLIEGDMVLVFNHYYDFIKTSPITKIVEQTDNYLKFETESSLYELELTDPEDD